MMSIWVARSGSIDVYYCARCMAFMGRRLPVGQLGTAPSAPPGVWSKDPRPVLVSWFLKRLQERSGRVEVFDLSGFPKPDNFSLRWCIDAYHSSMSRQTLARMKVRVAIQEVLRTFEFILLQLSAIPIRELWMRIVRLYRAFKFLVTGYRIG